MSNKTTEIDAIMVLLQQYPEGLSAIEFISKGNLHLERRTLIRRLNDLIAKGRVMRVGKGRGLYYKQVQPRNNPEELSVSDKASDIRMAVNRPFEQRKRVGYRDAFLESYKPNQTFYLTDIDRRHLDALNARYDGDVPAGTFARKILDRFLIDLSWNSSRLEGNTYSLLETEQLLYQGEVIQGKTPIETQMILNHKAAIEFLVEPNYEIRFDKFTLCNLHALLADNLLNNPDACGRVRRIPVAIGGSSYSPLDIPQKIEETLQTLLKKASDIKNIFEQSFFVMIHLPYLQPFEDVNKRVSRLSANIPFINKNYCPISFVDVPEKTYIEGLLGVYELNRIELLKDVFIWAYERSTYKYSEIRQTVGEPDPFRLRYRNFSYEIIHDIVTAGLTKTEAIKNLKSYTKQNIRLVDQVRFIEAVETELLALHEGNYARYKITPNAFKAWKKNWL